MKIPGIAYIIIGVFMAGLSGYVYKFIPRPDGTPNMSMALFFFIGVIFIIIGFIKLFFKKAEDTQEMEYHKTRKVVEKVTQQAAPPTRHRNRVEEQLNSAVQNQQQKSHQHQGHQHSQLHKQQDHTLQSHAQHSSAYAKTHPYHGMQKQDSQQDAHNHSGHHAPHISSISILACKRCGNKNPSTTNYCHSCGYGLK